MKWNGNSHLVPGNFVILKFNYRIGTNNYRCSMSTANNLLKNRDETIMRWLIKRKQQRALQRIIKSCYSRSGERSSLLFFDVSRYFGKGMWRICVRTLRWYRWKYRFGFGYDVGAGIRITRHSLCTYFILIPRVKNPVWTSTCNFYVTHGRWTSKFYTCLQCILYLLDCVCSTCPYSTTATSRWLTS